MCQMRDRLSAMNAPDNTLCLFKNLLLPLLFGDLISEMVIRIRGAIS